VSVPRRRRESFPEALLKVSQPAVGSGVVDALGEAAADVEAETTGIAEAEDPEVGIALVPQPATPAPRSNTIPVHTMAPAPVVLFIARVLLDSWEPRFGLVPG